MPNAHQNFDAQDIETFLEVEPLLRSTEWERISETDRCARLPEKYKEWYREKIHTINIILSDPEIPKFQSTWEAQELSPTTSEQSLYVGSLKYPKVYGLLMPIKISSHVRLTGLVDVVRLERAIEATLSECIALQAILVRDGEEWRQRFVRNEIQIIKTGGKGATTVGDLRALLKEGLAAPFDILNGSSATRVYVRALREGDTLVQFVTHILMLDGASEEIVVSAFVRNYIEGRGPDHPEIVRKRRAYLTYLHLGEDPAVRLREAIATARFRLIEPMTYPWSSSSMSEEEMYSDWADVCVLSRSTSEVLTRVGTCFARLGVFPSIVVMAGLLCMLRRLANTDKVGIVMPDSGRWYSDVVDVCGPFASSVYIGTRIDPSDTGLQLMQELQQSVSLRKSEPLGEPQSLARMAYEFRANIQMSRHTPFSVSARYDGYGGLMRVDKGSRGDVQLSWVQLFDIEDNAEDCGGDLSVSIQRAGEKVGVHWNYKSGKFSSEYVAAIDAFFATVVTRLVSDPHQSVESASSGALPAYVRPAVVA